MPDRMSVIERSGDPFDRITYHVENLRRVWRGEVVRDLDESGAGYESALHELRGAVEERDRYKAALDWLSDGNATAVKAALLKAKLYGSPLDNSGGQ